MRNYSMQELAFLGDAIHTLYVRKSIIAKGEVKLNELNKICSKFCSAKWQRRVYENLMPILNDEEQNILRMARNSKPKHSAKNANPADYHKATAFEALVGWFYLNEKKDRLDEILKLSIQENEEC